MTKNALPLPLLLLTLAVSTLMLTACNTQSPPSQTPVGGSPDAGSIENDCGNVLFHRDLNRVAIFTSSTKDLRADSGNYEWRAKQSIGLDISNNGGGQTGGSTISPENSAACAAVRAAFGSLGVVEWTGDRPDAFFDGLNYVYIDPNFNFVYQPRETITLQQWRADGEPETATASLISAELTVRYSKSITGGTQSIIDSDKDQLNSAVSITCEQPQDIRYSVATVNQPGIRDQGTCEQDSETNDWQCLAVSAVAGFDGCTFSTTATMIPDGAGNYYKVALGGAFVANEDNGYEVNVANITLLDPLPAP